MSFKFKNSYSFAFKTSFAISLVISLIVGAILWVESSLSYFYFQLIFLAALLFIISFLIIQSRIEAFIYSKIKNLYKELNLIDSISLSKADINTDMKSLLDNISEFSRDNKLEIESLKVREEFRKEFIGNVAHELKTPIFTIQGYIENLIDGAIDDNSVRDKFLNRAKISVERLIYIIKDLDMITKLESGTLNLEKNGIVKNFEMLDHVRMNTPGEGAFYQIAQSVIRAIRLCNPIKNLPTTSYEKWKTMILRFNPIEMMGGWEIKFY